jgi:hypothetical protein
MIWRLALPLAVVALALAGCGDDGGGDKPANGDGQTIGPSTSKLLQNTYDVAKQVCGEAPVEETARQLGLPPSASDDQIAEEYSKGSTPGPHQDFAFDGCLAGLVGRPRR